MKFTIITPSFNQLDYLKRCVASVRDQVSGRALNVEGVEDVKASCLGEVSGDDSSLTCNDLNGLNGKASLSVHHHVQDGGSTDGTREYLAEQAANSEQQTEDGPNAKSLVPRAYSFSFVSERDTGMYDAINKGVAFAGTRRQALGTREEIRKAKAEDGGRKSADIGEPNNSSRITNNCDNRIVAWLNCDEQYLPGTLEFVSEYFDRHPEVDILYGDYLMVDEEGELLSFRKGCTPRLWYIQASHLNNMSCTLFFRAGVFEALGGFDTQYKAVADEDFVVRALKAGFKARHVRRYFSIFTFTGSNLGGGAVGREEFASLKKNTPLLLKLFRMPLNLARWFEKFLRGTYSQKFPIEYEIYLDDADRRTRLVSSMVGWKWPASGPEGPTPRREDR